MIKGILSPGRSDMMSTMALLSFCVIVVLLVSCIAACSLVNSYGTSHRQKPTKARNVALPITILAVVYALAIAVAIYLAWFATAETFAIALFLAFASVGVLTAVNLILYDGAKKERARQEES